MKKFFAFFAALLFAGSMMADSYTITFKEGTGTSSDSGTKVSTVADIIATGAEYVSEIALADNVYNARVGRGIKLGTSSKAGSLTLTLASPVQATSIIVTARKYNDSEKAFTIQGQEFTAADGDDFEEFTLTYDAATEISSIALASPKRIYFTSVTVNYGGDVPPTPVVPDTIPTVAPAVPTLAEADVMGIYCNHYAVNNANFGISGWAGAYQVLDLNGTNVGYWEHMTWECIIDPVNTDAPHDFSAYENIHIDMWAPQAAKIKFTAEAVAGGNYKDGHIVDLAQGWNSFDFPISAWPGNYDFSNLKCFVFEMYQTPTGESFEQNPFAFANIYFWNTPVPVIPQYEVAEAIAAGLNENDEILVRGVITKMEFKGKNFAQYGSVNIYVKDATGAEGEFEFYNCYSLAADTFRTSVPDYDPTSTAWAQFTKVVDGNGVEVLVGDTVIAFGKYKLYNTTHELNTGCNLINIKHPGDAPQPETINIVITSEVDYTDAVASQGWWQFMAENDEYFITISNVYTTQAAGTYAIADLDPDYSYITRKADSVDIAFVDGSFVLTEGADGSRMIEGTVTGDDSNTYYIKLVYAIPTPETTVNVAIPMWGVADASEYYGITGYIFYGEAADSTYVQITIPGNNPIGTFTEDDCYMGGTGISVDGDYKSIYSINVTVELTAENRPIITADILCLNNTLYHVTTPYGTGIDGVNAAVKAIKRLVNGNVVIEKNGVRYGVNGARL